MAELRIHGVATLCADTIAPLCVDTVPPLCAGFLTMGAIRSMKSMALKLPTHLEATQLGQGAVYQERQGAEKGNITKE